MGLQIEALSKINKSGSGGREGEEEEEGRNRRGNVEGEYYECSSSGQLENLLEGVSEIIEGVFPIQDLRLCVLVNNPWCSPKAASGFCSLFSGQGFCPG